MTVTDPTASRPGTPAPADRVLVAYATRFGSTRGVAERIADTLERAGHPVDLRPCEEVEDPSDYGAVVFGSAVFDGRWLPEADRFIERNARALAARPVWLFTVGTFGDQKRLIGPLMRREPRNIEELTRAVNPLEYRVFAGVIERHQWPLASRLFFHALGGRLGDNRDWAAIEAWAGAIARSIGGLPGPPGDR